MLSCGHSSRSIYRKIVILYLNYQSIMSQSQATADDAPLFSKVLQFTLIIIGFTKDTIGFT